MSDSNKFVIRVRAVILHEGKLLVVRHAHDASYYALPGGHLEWGEDAKQCLEREIVEELGVRPTIGRLLYVNTFIDAARGTQPFEFFFEVTNGGDYADVAKLTGTHSFELAEVAWVAPTDNARILPRPFAADFNANAMDLSQVRFLKNL